MKLKLILRSVGVTLGLVLLSQCSVPVSVSMENPVAPIGVPAASTDINQQLIAIRDAYDRIRRGDDAAVPAYNYQVARLVENLEARGDDPWSAPLAISGESGILRLKASAPEATGPLQGQLLSADTLSFHGRYSEHRAQVTGVGAGSVVSDL